MPYTAYSHQPRPALRLLQGASFDAAPDLESLQMRQVYRGAHGWACFFHVGLKVLSFAMYLFGDSFAGYIHAFVGTVIFVAADFYNTKNISGRKMVGLRWWSGGDTLQGFRYETAEGHWTIDPTDFWFFWTALIATACLWAFLCLVAVIRFNFTWLPLAGTAALMSATNAVNYGRCNDDIRGTMKRVMSTGLRHAARNAPGMLVHAARTGIPLVAEYGRRAAGEAWVFATRTATSGWRYSVSAAPALARAAQGVTLRRRSGGGGGSGAAPPAPAPGGSSGGGISISFA